jgi:hypothetical protein
VSFGRYSNQRPTEYKLKSFRLQRTCSHVKIKNKERNLLKEIGRILPYMIYLDYVALRTIMVVVPNWNSTPPQETCILYIISSPPMIINTALSWLCWESVKHAIIASGLSAACLGTCHHVFSAITEFLDVVHLPVFKLKTMLRRLDSVLRLKRTQLGPIDRASPYLRAMGEEGEKSPVSETLFKKNRTRDNVQILNN